MKSFNLAKALQGEPVVLRDGSKAYIKFVINNENPLVGYYISNDGKNLEYGVAWSNDGYYRKIPGNFESSKDIVGMWNDREELKKANRFVELVPLTKGVNYLGLKVCVPEWTAYLATDENGEVYAYKEEPRIESIHEHYTAEGFCCLIGYIDLGNINWKDSLRDVDDEI